MIVSHKRFANVDGVWHETSPVLYQKQTIFLTRRAGQGQACDVVAVSGWRDKRFDGVFAELYSQFALIPVKWLEGSGEDYPAQEWQMAGFEGLNDGQISQSIQGASAVFINTQTM
ncbi:uncharacterized protein L969DRAFT_70707 [Mixia osmundae IAM 14324]|uniref:uncharacterized protein n=1 Tax=Mixia osmundae (strain CBS 9802 / IAM 14324 / JCM 22182 / KY 12970) TaxID=764103 RepID=UPI0004A54687|nr:uncharacterized protein L969DRAFT_70707 [Mixia osmundae IAM 14324]KEI41270.1 hypothetical protein L969DRAFT_70707 [Mixia osmundae IAM 14324]